MTMIKSWTVCTALDPAPLFNSVFALHHRRITELAMVGLFGLFITEQYVYPTIMNSYGAFNELQWLQMFERLLKLSVPCLWGWLVIFYTLFHLLLNITAELTRFGDREFYLVSLCCVFCYSLLSFAQSCTWYTPSLFSFSCCCTSQQS